MKNSESNNMVQAYIEEAIIEHKLNPGFSSKVEQWYMPLAERVASRRRLMNKPIVMGVQGTQGSGKSTLADFLKRILLHEFKLNCVVCSIDDFYLTRAERQNLARTVHPLFKTRGVPGTHDVSLAIRVLNELSSLDNQETTLVPSFNKAIDDRASMEKWTSVTGPIDVIILEGWCVGLCAQSQEEMKTPVNPLEAEEDPQGIWRGYANKQLAGEYQKLFSLLDCIAVINAPSFSCVFEWRLLQEQKLASKIAEDGRQDESQKLLTGQEVKRFIAHYQRLTELALDTMPNKADWLFQLDVNHNIVSFDERQEG